MSEDLEPGPILNHDLEDTINPTDSNDIYVDETDEIIDIV
jgi:hypothetical protein